MKAWFRSSNAEALCAGSRTRVLCKNDNSRGDICEQEQNVEISKFLFWEFKCCPLCQKGNFFINLFLKAKANWISWSHKWTCTRQNLYPCSSHDNQPNNYTVLTPLSPNIHIQILHTDIHRFPYRASWENLIKDQSIFSLVVMLFLLITFSLDNVWILLRENLCGSIQQSVHNHQALNSKDDPGALTSSFVLVIGGSISRSFLMACNGGSLK